MYFDIFKNYLKVAWRSMFRQKLHSIINLGGLVIGLTCFILILNYVRHELSYDRFYDNADQVYRIYRQLPGTDYLGSDLYAVGHAALAKVMEEEIPEIAAATTLIDQSALLGNEDVNFFEEGLWADDRFFEVFSCPFLYGNPLTALDEPMSIVVTQSLAGKLFKNSNAIGRTINYQNGDSYTVTAVIKDPPNTSSLDFSFLTSLSSNNSYQRHLREEQWVNHDFHTFFTLAENTNPDNLPSQIAASSQKFIDYEVGYFVQALSDFHLETRVNFDLGRKGNPSFIRLFSIIAVIILLLACANYMNLAIARSIKRAREVGVRKVVGARRSQLAAQFVGEATLMAFLALVLALVISNFLMPVFGHLLERELELNLFENSMLIPTLLLVVIVVGLISGSYPALLMSSLRPGLVLKGKMIGRFSGLKIQRWLMIGQYSVSIILIIGSLVIYRQFGYIQQKELGYDKENIVTIPVRDASLIGKYEALKSEWLKNPQILSVTNSYFLPTNITGRTAINDQDSNQENDLSFYENGISYDFLDVYGIELIAGRSFSPALNAHQEESYILNEMAVNALGWTPEEAVGKQFYHQREGKETIVGVVKDFHLHSLHRTIEPLMLRMRPEFFRFISIKINPHNLLETIAFLKKSFEVHSSYPFEYQLLDERFGQLYKADYRMGEIFGFFTALSILIASLGLFGLAVFVTKQRRKEISVRKILGASVNNIVAMLSKDLLKIVALGFAIAIPITWYIMHQWLNGFAYRIDLRWWMFGLGGAIVLTMALLTIGSQSLRAAFSNPVEALKSE